MTVSETTLQLSGSSKMLRQMTTLSRFAQDNRDDAKRSFFMTMRMTQVLVHSRFISLPSYPLSDPTSTAAHSHCSYYLSAHSHFFISLHGVVITAITSYTNLPLSVICSLQTKTFSFDNTNVVSSNMSNPQFPKMRLI